MTLREGHLGQDMAERFKEVAPAFFADRTKCVIILPPEAYHLFFAWVQRNIEELVGDNPIYDSVSTFPENYFGVRITDTPEVLERVLSETGVSANNIPYIIAHHPKHRSLKGQRRNSAEIAYVP